MLFIAKSRCLSGSLLSLRFCFFEAVVSGWVQWWRGGVSSPWDLDSRQCPCFRSSVFESNHWICTQCLVFRVYVPIFDRLWVQVFCLLALCCSCCDRWCTAHAQINTATLGKPGLGLCSSHPSYLFITPCVITLSVPLIHKSAAKTNWRVSFCVELK